MTDHDTNFVYVSDLLAGRFPSIYEGLERILGGHGIGFGIVEGTKDIWIRDYAPIQVDCDGSFVLFRYFPDYLRRRHRHLITDAREFIPSIPGIRSCEVSEIVLDGGNVVRHQDKAIVTDKVFRENRGIEQGELREELRRLLRVESLIVIPTEPGDVVGHADGVVRFVNGRKVVVNDYKPVDREYRRMLMRKFKEGGLEVAEIPYRPESESSDGMPSAIGNYVNYLQVNSFMLAPTYINEYNNHALEKLNMAFPGVELIGLSCDELARSGGVLNCIAWSISLQADRAEIADICSSGD